MHVNEGEHNAMLALASPNCNGFDAIKKFALIKLKNTTLSTPTTAGGHPFVAVSDCELVKQLDYALDSDPKILK